MKKTLYRYIWQELLPPFFLGLLGFTFILLTGRILQLTELFVNKGISFAHIAKFIYYLIPSFMVLTIPMAMLLAVMVAFSRMASDNEITALKSSGISLYQMVPPVILWALGAFILTIFFSLHLLPQANQASRSLLFEIASTKAHVGVKERVFNDDFEGLVIYVERVSPRTFKWENIFISDSRLPEETHAIVAREGEVLADPTQLTVNLKLKNGSIHKLGKQPEVYQKIDFATYNLRLSLKTGLAKKQDEKKHPADMTLNELLQAIRFWRLKSEEAKILLIKIHEKFTIPFACIVFGLIGIPLGAQSPLGRAGKSLGFSWSVAVILIYYLLTNAGNSLAERGFISVELGLWFPNFFFLGLSIYLLVKSARGTPMFLTASLNQVFGWLSRELKESFPPPERKSAK